MKSLKIAAIAAVTVLTLTGGGVTAANAQRGFHGGHGFHGGGFHGGFHRGWRGGGFGWGPAVVGGLAFGALAASPYYYGCGSHVVGYDYYGRPLFASTC